MLVFVQPYLRSMLELGSQFVQVEHERVLDQLRKELKEDRGIPLTLLDSLSFFINISSP